MLVHTIALGLIQRDETQGGGKKQKGTETSLTVSIIKTKPTKQAMEGCVRSYLEML